MLTHSVGHFLFCLLLHASFLLAFLKRVTREYSEGTNKIIKDPSSEIIQFL